jgi:predicted nucleotidyltransferase component of viral defense system
VNVPTKNLVASVLARLRNQAQGQSVPFNQVLQFYAMERFLYRLSKSVHVDGVLLKGALLLRQAGIPRARPTMDIDLLRQGNADRDSLIALVRDCLLIDGASDGIQFDSNNIAAEDIAKDSNYLGTRVRVAGRMDNVRLNVQIDFGVGDAVYPDARVIEYPTLLDQPALKIRAYPIEAVIAEKFQAMVELDLANSRVKDFYDIWVYSRNVDFDGETLAKSLAATFGRRQTPLPTELPVALRPIYFDVDSHRNQWQVFVRRIGETELSGRFAQVINSIAEFVMPPAAAAARLEPFRCHWFSPGPWGTADRSTGRLGSR